METSSGAGNNMSGGPGRIKSLRMSDLADELGQLGEKLFRAKYSHPFLVVVFTPPPESEEGQENTTKTSEPHELNLDTVAAPTKLLIPICKSGRDSTEERITLGREADCDIVILASRISKKHAAFVVGRYDRFSVIDLGSANGTVVRGMRLKKHQSVRIRSGDMVSFWRFMFQFLELDALLAMLQ